MESKNIIIILLVIIVILAAAIGFTLLNPANAKDPVIINITSGSEQYGDGELSVQLTDSNGTPISKEMVNVTVTNANGELVVDDVVKTDSDGKASLDFDLDDGEYTVDVAYGGNENYAGNGTTQNLTIKEKVAESTPEKIDYNSRNSDYFKSETDGAYHKKQPGVKYVYGQDGRTGEWCYWLDKS